MAPRSNGHTSDFLPSRPLGVSQVIILSTYAHMIVSHQLLSTNVTPPIKTSPAAQNQTRTKGKQPKLARNIDVDGNDCCPDSL